MSVRYLFVHNLDNPPGYLGNLNNARLVNEHFLGETALADPAQSPQLVSPQIPSGPASEVAGRDYYESGRTLELRDGVVQRSDAPQSRVPYSGEQQLQTHPGLPADCGPQHRLCEQGALAVQTLQDVQIDGENVLVEQLQEVSVQPGGQSLVPLVAREYSADLHTAGNGGINRGVSHSPSQCTSQCPVS